MSAVNELAKIYQKNILYFQKYYPDLFLKLSAHTENIRYELIVDDGGYFNIEIKANGGKLYGADSNLIAQQQVDNCLQNSSKTKKAIFIGTLLGLQIEKLILKTDAPCVMIIEPDLELFKLSAFLVDYEAITKSRFAIFSIMDSEKELKNKILEFLYTMFYYNNNTSYIKIVDEYQSFLDKIKATYEENIFYKIDANNIKVLKSKSNINLEELSISAQKETNKGSFSKAIKNYLQIIEYERYIKLNNKLDSLKEILLAYLNLGNLFYNQINIAEAYHCYGKCVYSSSIENDLYETALTNYVLINKTSNHAYDKMILLLEKHIKDNSSNTSLITSLLGLLYATNQYKKAEEFLKPFKDILEKERRMIVLLPPIPIIYNSQEEIDNIRDKLEAKLDVLLLQDITIPESKLLIMNSFYLAYHNRNNKNILSKLSSFYEKTTSSITYTAKHCKDYKYSSKKIKLGIISNHLIPNHPVVKFMKNIIESFNQNNNYEIHIFTFSKETNKIFSKNIHLLTGSLKEQRELIAKYKLDIAIYPEIGMHPATYLLAHARLAPVQCMFGGHPVTSGISNMDYFLSHKDLEIEDAQEHYSEKLVFIERLNANYKKPIVPKEFTSKRALGLLEDRHNYLIPAKLQKIHPDFDKLLAKIVDKDDKALFIFFKDNNLNQWDDFVKERILKTLDEKNVIFRPWADSTTFYSLLNHADAVLEPIIFGYGTTAIEAFSIGTPIVTLPSRYSGGRVTSWYYKKMGFDELIVSDENEYTLKAIKLASDDLYRKSCKENILKSNSILYDNHESMYELETFFKEALSHE